MITRDAHGFGYSSLAIRLLLSGELLETPSPMSKEADPTLAAGALTGDPPASERSEASTRGLHPDAETILAKAHLEMEKHASEMSLIEKQMARADTFKVGMKFRHDIHGPGVVVEILPDGRRRMEFANGERHAYKPSSMHKLHPIVDDAHTFSPACAAALGVQRSPQTRQPPPTGSWRQWPCPSHQQSTAPSVPTLFGP